MMQIVGQHHFPHQSNPLVPKLLCFFTVFLPLPLRALLALFKLLTPPCSKQNIATAKRHKISLLSLFLLLWLLSQGWWVM